LFIAIQLDDQVIHINTDSIDLIQDVPNGYLVYLPIPAGCIPGTKFVNDRTQALELTHEQAKPLMLYINSIAAKLF
jgi:hypothetical protein